MIARDGHVRVLPLHVANKIAAGEVVERPASVVKELVENAIDAGAKTIRISITQGGRKLVAVQDDGCGMSRDDAVLSLERQATSKILDVNDIEQIDTLGFRGEAIPSIASVSRFTLTTRRADSDEGTMIQVNAGQLAEVRAAGCPPGTLVEVRDLFCNVPARRKFLRAYVTEENHIRQVFTIHALAHPAIGFALTVDGRELYRLAPAAALSDRILDLFGKEFLGDMLPVAPSRTVDAPVDATQAQVEKSIRVTGYVEKPNLNTPTRRDQYFFINGRPATAPTIAYALREAYPRQPGDTKPAVILFIDLPPTEVDVNVHPTKREVRFRDNTAVKLAIEAAIGEALTASPMNTCDLGLGRAVTPSPPPPPAPPPPASTPIPAVQGAARTGCAPYHEPQPPAPTPAPPPAPAPTQVTFAVEPDSTASKPWQWFKFLTITSTNYLLLETDAGIVTLNPRAARERIAYERLLNAWGGGALAPASALSQPLLIPETVQLSPVDFARLNASLPVLSAMGFSIEPFGKDTFKVDAVPQLLEGVAPGTILPTIAQDLAESGTRRGGERWREELIAKSIARSYAGASSALTEKGAVELVEELCRCRSPYVSPRGKVVMIFTSTRELNRKFGQD